MEATDSESSGTDTNPQVINPGQHHLRQGNARPIPDSVQHINHWCRDEGIHPPYRMAREYYNHINRGTADKALPIIIRRINRQIDQARISINQILEVNATAQVNNADIL
ncbi:unnamed protein product [Lactuca saligna]|uniref:Uncharacterized protein n=1 Tax=Lactuca saligna TaxID=75948 RepID=A0AA35XZ92_LACSI|nr:unnamed protein product [Lactuca saligna]